MVIVSVCGALFMPVSVGLGPLAGTPSPLGIPWQDALPLWRADSHVIGFCQALVVVLGLAMSVVLLRRQLATHRSAWLGASGLALVLAAAGRWLVAV